MEISSAYRAFSKEKVMGVIGVHIGLNSVNVTLKAMPIYNQSSNIDYNERFHWIGATQMKEDYRAALEKVYKSLRIVCYRASAQNCSFILVTYIRPLHFKG